MNEQEIEVIEDTPMGDDNIRSYFPNAKIVNYNHLNEIDSIDDLLPNNKSYCFMLIEDSPNQGHWVCLNKLNGKIEFFDSYGGKPDSQLKWTPMQERKELGQAKKRLTQLLKKSGYKVNYNPVHYQQDGGDIQTCGRHCCLRIKNMLNGKDLDAYNKFMKQEKERTGMDYDEIVSFFIQN
jgi:hypothetical protein